MWPFKKKLTPKRAVQIAREIVGRDYLEWRLVRIDTIDDPNSEIMYRVVLDWGSNWDRTEVEIDRRGVIKKLVRANI
jgi:hypothetical protein